MNRVAVITRTRDRPEYVKRALKSLCLQRIKDVQWILVNDGAPNKALDESIAYAKSAFSDVIFISTDGNSGMEHAANLGVRAATSDLVTLLDDDDTWEPDFLSETAAYLDRWPDKIGVCTQSSIVNEHANDLSTPIEKYTMNPDLLAVSLADFMLFNRFTTNSLVYRRSAHSIIGYYREDLPVMGDWEFGIRLIRDFEVGVIPKPLANYHRRKELAAASDPASNTVIANVESHNETDARIRNEFLRRDLESGKVGLGTLLALARIHLKAQELQRFHLDDVRVPILADILVAKSDLLLKLETIEKKIDRLEIAVKDGALESERIFQSIRRWWRKGK